MVCQLAPFLAGRHADAIAILRELRDTDPRPDSDSRNDQRIAQRLFLSAMALRRSAEMSAIANEWAGRRRESARSCRFCLVGYVLVIRCRDAARIRRQRKAL